MTEQAKVPAIRFAGFTDPWEQRKLGDIAERVTRKNENNESDLPLCFALLNANPDYLVTYYETNRWHKAVQMIAAEGARNHGLLNIAPDDFFDTMVSLPESQAEQQTIGAFFSRLDSLITLHQRKCHSARRQGT